jgi:drug/metabolite transporter (DMT)-like permease
MVGAIDADLEKPVTGTTLALILVAGAAMLLAILPAVLALHEPGVPPGWAAGAVGALAGVIATGKLATMVWAAGSHLWGSHRASVAATYTD